MSQSEDRAWALRLKRTLLQSKRSRVLVSLFVGMVGAYTVAYISSVGSRVGQKTSETDNLSRRSVLPYDLANPNQAFILPPQLAEVSGLTVVSATEVACVQDEDGIIFIYDLQRQAVTREIRFGGPGDYEGLTALKDRFFVLRSDGHLFEVPAAYPSSDKRLHEIELPTQNNEGLGFDPIENLLLIAPKSRPGKGKAFKNRRVIFGFDMESGVLREDPVLEIDLAAVERFAEAHGAPLPTRKKKGRMRGSLRLMAASVAVHPITGEYYVLSAVDNVLAVFDRKGQVTGYALLDEERFRQPEGITFLPSGDMLISNEADGKKPVLLSFERPGDAR